MIGFVVFSELAADMERWFQVSPSVSLPSVPEEYLGKMYAFLVADADRDIEEPDNLNNLLMRDVVVAGEGGGVLLRFFGWTTSPCYPHILLARRHNICVLCVVRFPGVVGCAVRGSNGVAGVILHRRGRLDNAQVQRDLHSAELRRPAIREPQRHIHPDGVSQYIKRSDALQHGRHGRWRHGNAIHRRRVQQPGCHQVKYCSHATLGLVK